MKKHFTILLAIMLIITGSFVSVYAEDPAAGQTITVSSAEELKSALGTAASADESITVRLAEGEDAIALTSRLTVGENTLLDLNGRTVSSSDAYAFTISGENASITNGTIEGSGIRISSADTTGPVTNVSISNAPENGMYIVNASSVGDIKNNKISNAGNIGIYIRNKSSCGDIEGNTITGCYSHALRLTGNRTSDEGCFAGDIIDNTIADCGGHGISLYFGCHCGKISGNDLKDLGGHTKTGDFAIIVNAGSAYDTYAEEITHNTVDGIADAGIVAYSGDSSSFSNHGFVKGDIAYNTVKNCGTKKKKVDWDNDSDCSKYVCEAAIYVDSQAKVNGDIHHNQVYTSYEDGISVIDKSTAKNIYSNTVKGATNAGIAVKGSSKVVSITGNKISSSKYYGIFINSGSKITDRIANNTLTNPGRNGIALLKKSFAKTVSGNTVTNAGLYGVITGGSSSKITTLSKNTISTNNKKAGYPIFCNSKCCISSIKSNKVTGKYNAGIRIKSPSGKISVLSNTLISKTPKSCRSVGMSIDGCKKKTITIKKNKITGNKKGPGIYIKTSQAVIKSNTIKKVTSKLSIVKGRYKVKK